MFKIAHPSIIQTATVPPSSPSLLEEFATTPHRDFNIESTGDFKHSNRSPRLGWPRATVKGVHRSLCLRLLGIKEEPVLVHSTRQSGEPVWEC